MNSRTSGVLVAAIMLGSIFLATVPAGSQEFSFDAYVSPDSVNLGEEFFIYGTASGVDGVNILIVAPLGGNSDRIDGSGTGVYHKIASVSDTDDSFSLKITVGPGVMNGVYYVFVLHPGRDGTYDGFAGGVGVSSFFEEFEKQYSISGKSQEQIAEIIEDAITAPGSYDLMWTGSVAVEGEGIPYKSCAYSEEGVMSIDYREFECECTFHWTGDAAASLADYIDQNYWSDKIAPGVPDGICTEEELDNFVYHELRSMRNEELETNILIDDTRGEVVGTDCSYDYSGYGAIREDINIKCMYWIRFADLERSDEHVYSRVGLKDGDFVSFNVPVSWIISSAEDLNASSISSDGRTVTGLATDKVYAIKFSKAENSDPSLASTSIPAPTPTATSTSTYTPPATIAPAPSPTATPAAIPAAAEAPKEPGFEAILAVAGLFIVARRALRKR